MSLIIPNTFANATTDIALSDLDENFTALVDEINSNTNRLDNLEDESNSNTDRLDNIESGISVGETNITIEKDLVLPETTTIPTNSTINGPVGSINVPGCIIQVVQTVKTDTWSATPGANNFADITGLSVSITPKYSTSKILVSYNLHMGSSAYQVKGRLKRNNVPIALGDVNGSRPQLTFYGNNYSTSPTNADGYHCFNINGQFLDSPNTTDLITYSIDAGCYSTHTVYLNRTHVWQNTTDYDGTPISTITVMEVVA